MLKYNNTHIFTGYLKQLLSAVNLPACKVYTHEFAEYFKKHGKEDPRVLQSFDRINDNRGAIRINYIRNGELYNYFWKYSNQEADLGLSKASWKKSSPIDYDKDKKVFGLTRNLDSPGITYDTKTHEYLGDYLRFLRDYHNINLMSLYNCFTDKIYNNIHYRHKIEIPSAQGKRITYSTFDSQDPSYRIYAIPVKLFAKYTIAIDCEQGLEMFCGLYNTRLDVLSRAEDFMSRTYQKVPKAFFNQPFLYDKLGEEFWSEQTDFNYSGTEKISLRTDVYTRWDLINREKDLKLFIKVPATCRSSITILEGDFRTYNNAKYAPIKGFTGVYLESTPKTHWTYDTIHTTFKTNIGTKEYTLGIAKTGPWYRMSPLSDTEIGGTYMQFVAADVEDAYEATQPIVGNSYKLMLRKTSWGEPVFAAKQLSDSPGSLSLTADKDDALIVSIEVNDGLQYLTCEIDSNKYYINIISKGSRPKLIYQNNHSLLNFDIDKAKHGIDLNDVTFKPISKLQLLAFNTGESYPFADRLIEYLIGSAITPIDELSDNIKRVQKVMNKNGQYFKIEGIWENKMQNLLYDSVMNSGPGKVITIRTDNGEVPPENYSGPTEQVVRNSHTGVNPTLGYASKSNIYDILGYADKDTEKLYVSWKKAGTEAKVSESIQSVDIYDGLYDI